MKASKNAMVYNELIAKVIALQTVADPTQVLHERRRRGIEISPEGLADFSPYTTSRIKRLGKYSATVRTDPRPPIRDFPSRTASTAVSAVKDPQNEPLSLP